MFFEEMSMHTGDRWKHPCRQNSESAGKDTRSGSCRTAKAADGNASLANGL